MTLLLLRGLREREKNQPVPAARATATAPTTLSASQPATRPVADWRHGTGVCQVHHVRMKTVLVHNIAGPAPSYVPGYFEARDKLFPNAGIDYPPELYSQEQGLIYVCPECEAARNAWRP